MAILNCSKILGQINFTANTVNSPSGSVNAQGNNQVVSMALDLVQHRLFVSDSYFNGRILVFQLDNNNRVPGSMPITPAHVLGAPDFVTSGSQAVTSQTFGFSNLVYDNANARLFVSDGFHNRVLCFDCRPGKLTDYAAAVFVVGQADFVSSGASSSQTGLHGPDNADYDAVNGRLFVSDDFGNRIICFPVPNGVYDNSASHPSALFVLGQPDFTSGGAGSGMAGISSPTGMSYDPVNARIFISDYDHHRILCFSTPAGAGSEINGSNAVFVLGQPNFTTYNPTITRNGLNLPDDLHYDSTANRLWCGDSGNNRMVEFIVPNSADSSFNGANASQNMNASDWVSNSAGIAQNAFNVLDSGHAFDPVNNVLYLYELFGYRTAEFELIQITTDSLPNPSVGHAYSQTLQIAKSQGSSQAFSIASGVLPTGLSLNASTGEIAGIPTSPTVKTFTVQVDDVFSTGSFFHQKTFTLAPTSPVSYAAGGLAIGSGVGLG